MIPYIFRSMRLRQIWSVSEKMVCKEFASKIDEKAQRKQEFLAQERNLVIILFMCLTPFVVISVMLSVQPNWAYILPFFCISQCQEQTPYEYYDYINDTMQIAIIQETCVTTFLFICLFIIRGISPIFNATTELRQVVTILPVCFLI